MKDKEEKFILEEYNKLVFIGQIHIVIINKDEGTFIHTDLKHWNRKVSPKFYEDQGYKINYIPDVAITTMVELHEVSNGRD